MLGGKTWRHHLFVESESDVCTIILVIGVGRALGLHWLETGGSTLAHPSAGVHEALVIEDRNAALPTGAFAVPFVKSAGSRATPDLGAGDPAVQALAGVTVIIPFGPVKYHSPHGDARSP